MPSNIAFASPEGLNIIDNIVKKRVPSFCNGLRELQQVCIPKILNLEDLFAIDATGGGKSALFAVPLLVHLEIAQNRSLYPMFTVRIREKPVGIVVTPTKGLSNDIVNKLKSIFGISAFAYTHENIASARRAGTNLVQDISSCQFQLICVDPEHLREREWYYIANSPTFRQNIIFACAEEGHVIDEWGLGFRPMFRHIGSFFRGRLPSNISIFSMTATMQPGPPLLSVCTTLGFSGSHFHLIRRSNERPNTKIILETLTSAIGGNSFPQLLPYLNQRRKTIIHVRTIELGYRVWLYLFMNSPDSPHKLRRFRMYNSLASEKYNQKTIELLENDPYCQAAIATKAFSLGIHAETLVDSISVGMSDTLDDSKQNGGRAGRNESLIARRIIFATSTELTKAEKIASAAKERTVSAIRASKSSIDPAKAVFMAERVCRVACENIIYTNPPVETSDLDCIQAERRIPCDLCCTRYHIPEYPAHFPPSVDESILPPFQIATAELKKRKGRKKADELTKKEAEEFRSALVDYEQQLWLDEHSKSSARFRPRSSYFPKALLDHLVSNALKIHTIEDLIAMLSSFAWPFIGSQSLKLSILITSLQTDIKSSRRSKPKRAKRKARTPLPEFSSEEEHFSDHGEPAELPVLSTSTHARPPKRPALAPVNNQPRAKRMPQQTYAEAQSLYARPAGKSYRHENTEPLPGIRRSSRLQTKS